jgi:UDP-N-acetylglucosamine 2-epimerase (non-hydrolysing)
MKFKKKVITILGTRPEIIRLSRVIYKLDKFTDHKIIHTGQNYDFELDKIFFKNLKIRKPNYFLNSSGSFAQQISKIFIKLENILKIEKPDVFLVLGDTNSSVGAIIAKRLGIQVVHMEAGNRSYNRESPEEVNRKIIDHTSDLLLPYTLRSAENLVNEGIARKNIFVIGNPIYEVINFYQDDIDRSRILNLLKLKEESYFLVTLHREENVDNPANLRNFINNFNKITKRFKKKLIFPIHPRTKKNLKKLDIRICKNIKLISPLGFFDFVKLEKNAFCILTDSGTVQEEGSIFKKPIIITRDATERPETIESGSSIIIGKNLNFLQDSIEVQISNYADQDIVKDYFIKDVSSKVLKIVLSSFLND